MTTPQVANYSAYYRLPLGGYSSVQEEVNAHPGSFGYNEATHLFNLPPPTGRPELTFYAQPLDFRHRRAARAAEHTLAENASTNNVVASFSRTTLLNNSAGDNVTLNENLGREAVRAAAAN